MPIFNDTLLTEKGYELANKSANGQASFAITKAVASSSIYKDKSENELRQLTSLDHEFTGKIIDRNNVDNKKTAIKTSFSNELVPDGYTANTVGLYARDNNGDEFLYSVTTANIGQVIPEQSNNIFSGFELSIYVIVGNVQKMKVELTPGGDASVDYVEKLVSETKDDLTAYIDKSTSDIKKDLTAYIDNSVSTTKSDLASAINKKESADNHASDMKNTVKDNHDGSINFNGIDLSFAKKLNANDDILKLPAGIYASEWGFQDTLKNYPSSNGASLVIVSGIGNSTANGRKINIIDSWGGAYIAQWNVDHFSAWEKEVRRDDIEDVKNAITNSIQPKIDALDANFDKTYQNAVNTAKSDADKKFQKKLPLVPLKTTIISGVYNGTTSNSLNGSKAFFDPNTSEIKLEGFINCSDGSLFFCVDMSNVFDKYESIDFVKTNIPADQIQFACKDYKSLNFSIWKPGNLIFNEKTIQLKTVEGNPPTLIPIVGIPGNNVVYDNFYIYYDTVNKNVQIKGTLRFTNTVQTAGLILTVNIKRLGLNMCNDLTGNAIHYFIDDKKENMTFYTTGTYYNNGWIKFDNTLDVWRE